MRLTSFCRSLPTSGTCGGREACRPFSLVRRMQIGRRELRSPHCGAGKSSLQAGNLFILFSQGDAQPWGWGDPALFFARKMLGAPLGLDGA